MLAVGVIFTVLQMTRPDPPSKHSIYASNQPAAEIERKYNRSNRRPNEFYRNIIVHFDLKGAPPRVPYFLELLELIGTSGATGVLLEWEDMFPYEGVLKEARNSEAYSLEDVRLILQKAKSLDLDVIPLVQTFGHLEWILKLENFRRYRENDAHPQVLCLANQAGLALVKDALSQVIKVHREFGLPYLHIGADEAFEFGGCPDSMDWIRFHRSSREELALTHLRDIAQHVMKKSPKTVVLAWNDMLKSFPPNAIDKLQLGKVIEPVVWDYSEGIVTQNEFTWQALAANFPTAWVSSAFKGANYPAAQYIDVQHYEKNNRAWIRVKQAIERKFNEGIRGIIITGWQRYDHMSGLCEILPIGTPSMVLQIETAVSANDLNDQRGIRERTRAKLNCSGFSVAALNVVSTSCAFPGFLVYLNFQSSARHTLDFVKQEVSKNHQILGWLNPYSDAHSISQNYYLEQIEPNLAQVVLQLKKIDTDLRSHLSKIFFPNTVEEFMFFNVGQDLAKYEILLQNCRRLLKLRVWPKRNFPIQKPSGEGFLEYKQNSIGT